MKLLFPILIAVLLIYSLIKKSDPYSAFVEGARDAIPTLVQIFPNLALMLGAIAVFRAGGGFELLSSALSPALSRIGIPAELIPIIILRPFSGSGALALLADVIETHGADSFIGNCASVCVGSTETIVYTIALYCGAVGIKKTSYAIPVALISGAVGIITGIAAVRLFML